MRNALIIREEPGNVSDPQVDLVRENFNKIIWQHGYDVLHEKALKCPCKNKASGQQSNCKNCGGTGWAFINGTKTRMVMHSMNLNTTFKEWSETALGTSSITCMDVEKLGYMDRVTVLKGESIYDEVLYMNALETGEYVFFTVYDIKYIEYIAAFKTINDSYTFLYHGVDFTYVDNVITLDKTKWESLITDTENFSITIRYAHAPQFHVLDIPRDTMVVFTKIPTGKEKGGIVMPVHAVGRRSHYVLDAENYAHNRIIDNSKVIEYTDMNPPLAEEC